MLDLHPDYATSTTDETDKRIELQYAIADCVACRRMARARPNQPIFADRALALESLLVDLANDMFPHVACRDFEDVIVAYEGSLS